MATSINRRAQHQDLILNGAMKLKQLVTVFLINGFQLRGVITGHDDQTVVLDGDGKQQMIYKHAISTVIPSIAIILAPDTADS